MSESSIVVRRSISRVAYYDNALPADLVELLWNEPETLSDAGEPLQCKDVRRTVRVEWQSQYYVVKHYVEPTWRHALKHAFERSRGWRTFSAMRRLADAGIPTPRPLACIENPWGQLRRDSFMIYPYVEGQPLRPFLDGTVGENYGERFWRQLRLLWRKLARLRVSLSDTNVRNFIVCPAGRVWVLDLDKTRFHWFSRTTARYHRQSWNRLVRSVELARQRASLPQPAAARATVDMLPRRRHSD